MTQFNTPWEFLTFEDDGYADVRDARGLTICNVPLHTAAHIVRCVNSHQGLMDALHTTCERLKDMGHCMGNEDDIWEEVDNEISMATKALTAAGEKL